MISDWFLTPTVNVFRLLTKRYKNCFSATLGSVLLRSDRSQSVGDDMDETAPLGTNDYEEDVIQYVHKEKDFICLQACTVGMLVFIT